MGNVYEDDDVDDNDDDDDDDDDVNDNDDDDNNHNGDDDNNNNNDNIPKAHQNLNIYCWFSPLLREVFLRVLRFSPLLKNQHFQIPIRSEHTDTFQRLLMNSLVLRG